MKKSILCLSLLALLPLGAWAYDFEVDGICYTKTSDTTVEVAEPDRKTAGSNKYQGDIVVPASITVDGQEYQVTAVGDAAFSSQKITSISLPDCVKTIGKNAFFSAYNIKEIKLPEQLETIGEMAFGYTDLKTIELPEGLLSIGTAAFEGNSSLKEAIIPTTVKEIGEQPFNMCGESPVDHKIYGLTTLKVAEGNPFYDSRNDCNAIIETATSKLVQGTSTTVVPDDIKILGGGAFGEMRGFQTFYIPASVDSIGAFCLNGCLDVKDLYVANPTPSSGLLPFGRGDGLHYDEIVLHVPIGSKSLYAADHNWKLFKNVEEYDPVIMGNPTSITMTATDRSETTELYTVDGKQLNSPSRGIVIVRQKDGNTKKVVVK